MPWPCKARTWTISPNASRQPIPNASALSGQPAKTWATSGQIPARLSVQQDPEVQGIWSVKAAADQFNAFGKTEVPHKAFIEIQTAWETAVSAVLTNTTPIDQALQEGNTAIADILARP